MSNENQMTAGTASVNYKYSDDKEFFFMAFHSRSVLTLLPKNLRYLWVLSEIALGGTVPSGDPDVITAVCILTELGILDPQSLETDPPAITSGFRTAAEDYRSQTCLAWDHLMEGGRNFSKVETWHLLAAFIQTKIRCGMVEVTSEEICGLFDDDEDITLAIARLIAVGYLFQGIGGYNFKRFRATGSGKNWEFLNTPLGALFEAARERRSSIPGNGPTGLLAEIVSRRMKTGDMRTKQVVFGKESTASQFDNPDLDLILLARDISFLRFHRMVDLDAGGMCVSMELINHLNVSGSMKDMSELEKDEVEDLKSRVTHLERSLCDALVIINELNWRVETLSSIQPQPYLAPSEPSAEWNRDDQYRRNGDSNHGKGMYSRSSPMGVSFQSRSQPIGYHQDDCGCLTCAGRRLSFFATSRRN